MAFNAQKVPRRQEGLWAEVNVDKEALLNSALGARPFLAWPTLGPAPLSGSRWPWRAQRSQLLLAASILSLEVWRGCEAALLTEVTGDGLILGLFHHRLKLTEGWHGIITNLKRSMTCVPAPLIPGSPACPGAGV